MDNQNVRLIDLEKEGPEILAKKISLISDIMERNPRALMETASLAQALKIMSDKKFRHFPVINENKVLVGVISDRDILKKVSPLLGKEKENESDNLSDSVLTQKIGLIMNKKPLTVKPETELLMALDILLKNRINCLPVVDRDDKLVGIVTTTDFLLTLKLLGGFINRL